MYEDTYFIKMITIRKAKIEDAESIYNLIYELAIYEKAPHEVTNTIEKIKEDGFGAHPIFSCIVAEVEAQIVGISLYYIRYSTWKGKTVYLEDIIVTEKMRGKGIGNLLFEATKDETKKLGLKRMVWQVLDWNEPAIHFYKKYDAWFDPEWINCGIEV